MPVFSDEDILARVRDGETQYFDLIMHRYNQRLFRLTRCILLNDHEAEDVVQETYVRAYQHLRQFAGEAKFATWLTKIALHEALARAKRRHRFEGLDLKTDEPQQHHSRPIASPGPSPEQHAMRSQAVFLLESVIDTLPEAHRCVFILRDVEGMTTSETAECLDITEDTVKVRLHRARRLLRRNLAAQFGIVNSSAFEFLAYRCDLVTAAVHNRIQALAERS